MARRVLIDEAVWDAICMHYAGIPEDELTDEDRRVLEYMADKLRRQIERLTYNTERD